MKIPDWYSLLLLGVAAWRTFQLLAHDDILDQPRRWVLRMGKEWQEQGDPVPDEYRLKWALFLTCPYCAGFWIAVVWWLAWQITPFWTEVFTIPFVLNAIIVAASKTLSKEEDKTVSPDGEVIADALSKIRV
jgi:Protein of unknown function (DUF1360)